MSVIKFRRKNERILRKAKFSAQWKLPGKRKRRYFLLCLIVLAIFTAGHDYLPAHMRNYSEEVLDQQARKLHPFDLRDRDRVTGRADIVDGDTLKIHGQSFRLYGIDAPEDPQTCEKNGKTYRCGRAATEALSGIINGQDVTCDKKDVDSYGRIVAICFTEGVELNRWMVSNGHALAYRHYSNRYLVHEYAARKDRAGIWAGTFQKPWDFRHSRE